MSSFPAALVFDFDGLLCDTEGPSYRAWAEQFESRGHTLALDRWLLCVGTHHSGYDPFDDLVALAGPADRDAIERDVDARWRELAAGEPCRPGVEALL
ncbi:MAG: HAD family hydrolase, partial [Nitriliruptorales bacterium]